MNGSPHSDPPAPAGPLATPADAEVGVCDAGRPPFGSFWDPRRVPHAGRGQRVVIGTLMFGFGVLCIAALLLVQMAAGLVFALGYLVVSSLSGGGAVRFDQPEEQAVAFLVPLATATTLVFGLLLALLLFGRSIGRRIAWRGLSWTQLGLVVLLVLPLAVLASEVTNWAGRYLPQLGLEDLMAFSEFPFPLVFVAACLLPGIGEEIIFRGCLGRGLLAWNGLLLGTLLCSLLFGLVHVDPVQASGAFVLGFGLHFVYLTTRSLLAPIVLHTLNNALAVSAYRWSEWLPVPGFSAVNDGVVAHTPWPVLVMAVAAAACLLAALARSRTIFRLPDGQVWSPGYATAELPDPPRAAVPESNRISWMGLVGCVLMWAGLVLSLLAVSVRAT